MKKIFLYAITALLSASCYSQQKDTSKVQKPQIFTVSGSLETFQRLLDVLDNSTAPHTDVKALEQWLATQIKEQLKQNTAPKK
jgi:hypothetical protein